MKYVFDLNPYVEARAAYRCDKLVVELVEANKRVTVNKADTYGAAIADGLLMDNTYPTLQAAIDHYNGMILQLQQGDIIRAV